MHKKRAQSRNLRRLHLVNRDSYRLVMAAVFQRVAHMSHDLVLGRTRRGSLKLQSKISSIKLHMDEMKLIKFGHFERGA